MKKIAFLQSYDQTSESRIQEGFEAGYQETFDSAFRIGLLLGELATSEKFKQDKTTDATQSSSLEASRQVRTFVTSFQERANNKMIDDAKSELENFEKELPETIQG
jgi:flagellar biosynthesis/type III secretory pathway protein FliH